MPSPQDQIVEAMLHARVPGGAEVWHWLPQGDDEPHQTAREVMKAALTAALPLILEEAAKVADDAWQEYPEEGGLTMIEEGYRDGRNDASQEIGDAIRTLSLNLREDKGSG